MKRFFLLLILFSLFFSIHCFSQTPPSPSLMASDTFKFAVVDINRIIEEHPVSILWDQELSSIKEQREISVRDQIYSKFGITDESQLSDSQKSEVQKFVIEENEKFRQEMIPQRDERLKIVESDILDFSALLAKQKSYHFVLDKSSVIFGGTDITDTILSMSKEKHSK